MCSLFILFLVAVGCAVTILRTRRPKRTDSLASSSDGYESRTSRSSTYFIV